MQDGLEIGKRSDVVGSRHGASDDELIYEMVLN